MDRPYGLARTCYKFDVRHSSSAIRARIDAAPAYELILSMSAVAAGVPTSQLAALRSAAPDLSAEIARFAPSDWMWAHLVTVVAESPAPRDTAAFRAYLEAMPAVELLRRLVGYYVRWFRRQTAPELVDRAAAGDVAAIRAVLRTSQPEDALWQSSLRGRLEAGAARTKVELMRLLEAWESRAWAPALGALRRELTAATNLRTRSLRGRCAEEIVSAFTGWSYVAEPGITRIILVPSLVLTSLHEFEHEQTKFICVPLERIAPPRAPDAVLRPIRALADERRLLLVQTLSEGDLGAQELAERTGVSLATVLHHLSTLRDAGLVAGGGRRRPYRLSRSGLRHLADRIGALTR